MISKETLEAVRIGILSDEQLKEAIKHYSDLEKSLQVHGEKYYLVWKDVYETLNILNEYQISRKRK